MKRFLKITGAAILMGLLFCSAALCASPLQLLTVEEAALPEAKNFGFATALRNDGPSIRVRDLEVPPGEKTFPLEVAFDEKDSTPVDVSTLKVECLKNNTIDLTPRIRPYAGKDGVKVASVSLPPGAYRFRVGISDCKGRFSEKEFMVKVSVTY